MRPELPRLLKRGTNRSADGDFALARGRKNVDKRQALAKRDAAMDQKRELARATSGKGR